MYTAAHRDGAVHDIPPSGDKRSFLWFLSQLFGLSHEVHFKELLTEGLSALLSASLQMVNIFHPLKQAITYCLDLSYLKHIQLLLLKFLL